MYAHPNANTDPKPISIIITTLAARAYRGEANLIDAVRAVPLRMMREINSTEPRVPNPVNPEEDFADKWKSEPELETHFRSEEHTSELQSRGHVVCRLLREQKNKE